MIVMRSAAGAAMAEDMKRVIRLQGQPWVG
jgi:hypothetical protein